MAVLYQKYRPQRFADVVGQDPIVRTLQNASKNGQLAHAYLFTGSRGIGKTTLARLIAKAANCESLDAGDPCNACNACTAIASGNFLDVIEIDAASHTGVDNVRELIDHVQFKPTYGRMKVFIIDEVHMLSKAAFNALLKTLEEPPSHAMFVLATTDIEKVPDTIISRTQRFDYRKIGNEHMLGALRKIADTENLQLPSGTLELIIANAEGGMRDALSLLDTVAALGNNATVEEVRVLLGLTSTAVVEELVGFIVSHNAAQIPQFFDEQLSGGTDVVVFNRHVLEYLRQMLVTKVTGLAPESTLLNSDQRQTLQLNSDRMSMPQLMFVIRLFLRSYKEIGQSPSPELPVLLAAVEASLHGTAAIAPAPQPIPAAKSVNVEKPASAPQYRKQESPPAMATVVVDKPLPVSASEMSATADAGPIDETITYDEVLAFWPDVLQRIKTVNSPLATLLRNSPIHEVSGGKIILGVKYLFHKEHVENTKHTALILETITAVSGKRVLFKTTIVKEPEEPTLVHTVDALTDAIKIFGGELVE